jgi:Ca2+-binding RTX toxin-like protein
MTIYNGTSGDDRLDGGAGDDEINGLAGNDQLYGHDGNDVLSGGAGQDYLTGGLGNDTLTGGADSDGFAVWSGIGDTSTDTITDFTAGGGIGIGIAGDWLSIPTWQFSGYTGGNPFGNGYARLTQSGSNTLLEFDSDGPGGAAAFQTAVILNNVSKSDLVAYNLDGFNPNVIPGTAGADSLSGTTGDDWIEGAAGNDTLNGLAGDDTLYGGSGDDVLNGGDGNDQLYGDDGNDVLSGGAGQDYLTGGLGNDTLTGGGDSDGFTVWSGIGDTSTDTITDFNAGFGVGIVGDWLSIPTWQFSGYTGGNPFGNGYARLTQSGSNTLLEFDTDGLAGAAAFQTAVILNNVSKSDLVAYNLGGFNPNVIPGTAGADSLSGTAGDDWIEGAAGNDTLNGLAGNDTLYGGSGNDVLNGGDGNDQLYGDDGNDVLSGGTGNDNLTGGLGNDTLTGGADSDSFTVWSGTGDTSTDTITDFTFGNSIGADWLLINPWQFSGYTGGNPFGNGYARLTQSGSNSLLEFDTDGPGGAAAFQTVAILNNVSKSDLVAYNLNGFNPNVIPGTAGADSLSGTAGDDWIEGAAGNDTLNGLAGNDTLYGGSGNDVLNGGDGNDQLYGDDGNDVLSGGAGTDNLTGGLGNDTLTGGADSDSFTVWSGPGDASTDTITDFTAGNGIAGDRLLINPWQFSGYTGGNPFGNGYARLTQSGSNSLLEFDSDGPGGAAAFQTVAILNNVSKSDLVAYNLNGFNPNVIPGAAGPDSLSGTAGDDWIEGAAGNDTLNGLAGNDTLYGGSGNDVLNGGDGNDQLYGDDGSDVLTGGIGQDYLTGGLGNDTLTGGADSDGFTVWSGTGDTSTDTITDFTAGIGIGIAGDSLSIPTWLFSGYTGGNPFGNGYARLTQSGSNTLLEVDTDGPGGAAAFQTAVILNNVSKSDLLAYNLNGFNPNVIPGTAGADSLSGTAGDDWIEGAAGNDTLNGLAGNDTLYGGSGNDVLNGGDGNDQLYGDDGNDVLSGGAGTDNLTGGLGNDTLTGGADSDSFTVWSGTGDTSTDTITDFTVGNGIGADRLSILTWQFSGYTGTNPFSDGFARLTQSGSNSLLEVDSDGPGGAAVFQTAVILNNVSKSDLVAYNLNGFNPNAIVGTAGADSLSGTAGDDWIEGAAGNDTLNGLAGDDAVYGGSGNDVLNGGDGNDQLYGDDGNDVLNGGTGQDFLTGGLGNDTLTGGADSDSFTVWSGPGDTSTDTITDFTVGNGIAGDRLSINLWQFSGFTGSNPFGNGYARLTQSGSNSLLEFDSDGPGGAAAFQTVAILNNISKSDLVANNLNGYNPNAIVGTAGADSLSGTAGDDWIEGAAGNDTLNGLAGNDTLYGGSGNDVVNGGDGNDLLHGDDGNDVISGGAGNDNLTGALGNDTLTGGGGL